MIQDMQYLSAILRLALKLDTNDVTINEEVSIINSYTLSEDDLIKLEEFLVNAPRMAPNTTNEFLLGIINQINGVNKDFILNLIKLRTTSSADLVSEIILLNLSFRNNEQKYRFYQELVSIAVRNGDQNLIQAVLSKIEDTAV